MIIAMLCRKFKRSKFLGLFISPYKRLPNKIIYNRRANAWTVSKWGRFFLFIDKLTWQAKRTQISCPRRKRAIPQSYEIYRKPPTLNKRGVSTGDERIPKASIPGAQKYPTILSRSSYTTNNN